MNQGQIHIYIGNGKGKTTAAVGLAVRAAGAGKKVLFCQFVKSSAAKQRGEWPLSSEIGVLKNIKGVTVKVLGQGFVGILGDGKKRDEHARAAGAGLRWLTDQIKSGKYQVIVADELISSLELKLLAEKEVRALFALKNKFEVLVLTGHRKYNGLITGADLVTEMKLVKHPYYKGMIARRGIDF